MKKFSKNKYLISIITTIIATFLTSLSVYAASGLIINDKAYVPVRGVFEYLGFSVDYDNTTATAIMKDNRYTIEIPKNKDYFIVNNEIIKQDTLPETLNGSMYLPLRAIKDCIGATLSWDKDTKTAHISYNGQSIYINCSSLFSSQSLENKNQSNNNLGIDNTRYTIITEAYYKEVSSLKTIQTFDELHLWTYEVDTIFKAFLKNAQNTTENDWICYMALALIQTSSIKNDCIFLDSLKYAKPDYFTTAMQEYVDNVNNIFDNVIEALKTIPTMNSTSQMSEKVNAIKIVSENINEQVNLIVNEIS